MTEQEKREKTARNLKAVRANYYLLKSRAAAGRLSEEQQGRIRAMRKWLEAAEKACRVLRAKEGKSRAKIRHDWLTARALEMTVFQNASGEKLRAQLAGPRMLNRQYAHRLMEAAICAVEAAAEEEGLFETR